MDNKPSQEALLNQSKIGLQRLKEYQNHKGWTQIDKDPCKMFKMDIDGRTASKGQAIINYNIQQVLAFLAQPQSTKRLNNSINKVQVLQLYSDTLKVSHRSYDGSWPVQGRDIVMVSKKFEVDDKYYLPAKSCQFGVPQQKGVTRAQLYIGGYILQKIDQNKTKVTYISDTDIKGSIPSMIKNQLNKKQGSLPSRIQTEMKKDKK